VVAGVTWTPPIVTTSVTSTVNVCGTLLLIFTVHVATLPLTVGVPHVVTFSRSGVGVTVGVIELNTTGDAPAGNAVAVTVNVCSFVIGFVALCGGTAIDASTNCLVAGPLPPGPETPDVERTTVATAGRAPGSLSVKFHTAVAFATNVPAVELLIVIVHVAIVPVPSRVGVAQLSVFV